MIPVWRLDVENREGRGLRFRVQSPVDIIDRAGLCVSFIITVIPFPACLIRQATPAATASSSAVRPEERLPVR